MDLNKPAAVIVFDTPEIDDIAPADSSDAEQEQPPSKRGRVAAADAEAKSFVCRVREELLSSTLVHFCALGDATHLRYFEEIARRLSR